MPKRSGEKLDKNAKKIRRLERKLAKYKEKTKDVETEMDPEICSINVVADSETLNFDFNKENEPEQNEIQDELDNSILSALGEPCTSKDQHGTNIHEEIVNTFKNILTDGLLKQRKEEILETMLIPGNCKLLHAPKLNIEIVGALSNPSKSRDNLLEERQKEIGLAIAGISQVINTMSRKEFDKLSLIKMLTDITRILSNLHHQYTEIRRKLVKPFFDKNLMEGLKNNKRGEFLYSDLDQSVKSFSALKRSSNMLKTKISTITSNNATLATSSKNYQQPVRRQNQYPPLRGSYRGRGYYQPQPSYRPQTYRRNLQQPASRGRAKYP
ncbi:hypothetical protein ACJJTC_003456 [Scirpophaga incertulas]